MAEGFDPGWELMPEPVGGVAGAYPGDGIEESPNLFGLVLLQDRVDIETDREADSTVFGVERLDSSVSRCCPGFLGIGPGGELSIVGYDLALWSSKADRVEVLRILAAGGLDQWDRDVYSQPFGDLGKCSGAWPRDGFGGSFWVLAHKLALHGPAVESPIHLKVLREVAGDGGLGKHHNLGSFARGFLGEPDELLAVLTHRSQIR